MSSQSHLPYSERRAKHPVAKRLFTIAEQKRTNIVLSADLTDIASLLAIADRVGPYIAVLKTHIDIVSDFSPHETPSALRHLAEKHNFLIFEDRKLVDIGSTLTKQYTSGIHRIADWADIVNFSVLGGEGVARGLDAVVSDDPGFKFRGQRAFLALAEMTSKGSLATGRYTEASIEVVRKFESCIGFVATRALNGVLPLKGEGGDADGQDGEGEDMVVFTTGINMADKGDALGQQYQTPEEAVAGGSDFLIAGRGIYAAPDPVEAVMRYKEAGWRAYEKRVGIAKA